MHTLDVFVDIVLGSFLYVGGYQSYFFVQRLSAPRARVLTGRWIALDERIPAWPAWIWFYTVLFYPVVVVVCSVAAHDHRQFAYIAFSYMFMLAVLCFFFLIFPIMTPPSWRSYDRRRSISHRFLAFTQDIDWANNCFPSGHAAIAVITAYHMANFTGLTIALAFALSIILSCLFCKQHYILDVLAGAGLGWLTIEIYAYLGT
jgi:membrane-associated phospholipid phosphatase